MSELKCHLSGFDRVTLRHALRHIAGPPPTTLSAALPERLRPVAREDVLAKARNQATNKPTRCL